ncbi:MAG: glycoside hydrolase family 13 protein [Alphaproteobacteria bacterium]
MTSHNPTWWKEAIVYEIYPRSFKDSNNDGIGDIVGIIEKLDYLQELGIDMLWLCPFFKSPMDDMGYDISDFCAIDAIFGTMEDFDRLIIEAKKRNIFIMIDLVMNHCSDEHFWFKEACKSEDNPYHDYFIWSDKPNNWQSIFRGSVWEYVPDLNKYYLHIFSKKQPDLNWKNPKLRQEMKDIMRFWLNKGVKALRFDAITAISKPEGLPDIPPNVEVTDFISFGPHLQQWLEEVYQEVLAQYDVATVGEGPPQKSDAISTITGDDKCLQSLHVFGAISQDVRDGQLFQKWPFDAALWYKHNRQWIEYTHHLGIWNTSFIQNHDHPRIVSRYGNDGEFWEKSAILWAVWNLTQKATIYIYQGDELGMKNFPFTSINQFRDIQILNLAKEITTKGEDIKDHWQAICHRARDNARTPMQWDKSQPYYGFSKKQPWIAVNDNQIDTNNSPILPFYQKLISLRKAYKDILVYGDIIFDDYRDNGVISYLRKGDEQSFQIVMNFSDDYQEYKLPKSEILFNNYNNIEPNKLKPWQAVISLI